MGLLTNNDKKSSQINKIAGEAHGAFNAVLDQGSTFEGKLSFEGVVRIDGQFMGDIHSEAHLVVGQTGLVKASVNVDVLTLAGTLVGDVVANKIELQNSAKLQGDIKCPVVVMEEGAQFDGKLQMSSSSAKLTHLKDKQNLVKEGHA